MYIIMNQLLMQIPENEEFVNQTKRIFREMASCHGLNISEFIPTSLNYESYGSSGVFPSLAPSGSTNVENNNSMRVMDFKV